MNNKYPLVSVVINCYNGERFLKEAIDSVYSQSYNNWEIIFWDNSSTDNSSLIAKSYDNRLRYYYNKNNVPLGEARNKAVTFCKGDFICFLDTDDIMCPNKLECQLPLFKNKKVGIVSSQTFVFKDSKVLCIRPDYKNIPVGNIFSKIIENYFLSIDSVIIRKTAFDNILGGYIFNEDFKISEEADLFTRILFNWHFDFYPAPLSKRRIHSNNLTKNNINELINENIKFIENLYYLIPNFKIKYKKSIRKNKLWILNIKAVYLIQLKKNKEARKLLKNFIFCNSKSFFLFLILLFPKKIAFYIFDLFKKTNY